MDKSRHAVTIPVEDYQELLAAVKNQISKEELERLHSQAGAWSVEKKVKAPSILTISTAVPDWFHLGELHVYQKFTNVVIKKYKLVEIEDKRLDMRDSIREVKRSY